MGLGSEFATELEQEAATTRRVLERIPGDRLGWRPHPRSFSVGQLGLHIAGVAPGVSRLALEDRVELPDFAQAEPAGTAEIIAAFDQGVSEAADRLRSISDGRYGQPWQVVQAGQVKLEMPRAALVRKILLNQLYHHRGQLTVYLRQLEIPVPSVYGPSADEMPF
ncbi:MAG: DinB family protein [Gemmatimonadales bacterium]